MDAIKPAGQLEQAAHHGFGREILPQGLVRNRKLFLLELLEQEGQVPGLDGHAGKFAQLGQLGFSCRPRMRREVAQEFDDLPGRLRHLGGKRIVRVAVETHQLRSLMAECQYLFNVVAVVPLVVRPLVRRPGHPAVIKGFAQRAIFGVCHDGVVRRKIEGQHPAFTTSLRSLRSGALQNLRRQSLEFGGIVHGQGPGVRGILDVVVEIGLDGGEGLHDLPKSRLLPIGEIHSREVKIPQCLRDGVSPCLAALCRQAAVHAGVGLLQPGIL